MNMCQLSARRRRRGFTLVELLTVITIIGILVSLVSVAVFGARRKAQKARITAEIQQMDMAFVQLAETAGDNYPPDFTSFNPQNNGQISQFFQGEARIYLARRFPNFRPAPRGGRPGDLNTAIVNLFSNQNEPWRDTQRARSAISIDPAEALVFWLGGLSLPLGVDSSKIRGFGANAANPFEGQAQQRRVKSMFEFDEGRLVDRDNDGWYEYIPPGNAGGGNAPPYVYFNSKSYSRPWNDASLAMIAYPKPGSLNPAPEWGLCTPYRSSAAVNAWVNPKKFQIISAGLDGFYSGGANVAPKKFPNGDDYDTADLDNLANFVAEGDLESAKP